MTQRKLAENMLGIVRPPYAWRIDTWLMVDGEPIEQDGTVIEGPGGAAQSLLDALAAGEGSLFRLSDDDGNHYCEGRILIPTDDDMDGELEFAPLWDYGTPGMGCTDIAYKVTTDEGRVWKSL